MTDLTKLTAPFGLLDEVYGPGTRGALKAWPHGWEAYSKKGWVDIGPPPWVVSCVYRAKPAPLTKPSIDWSLCPDWANWLAENESGKAFIFEREPKLMSAIWLVTDGGCSRVEQFPFYTPGTCDWKDSLVQKPEGDQ